MCIRDSLGGEVNKKLYTDYTVSLDSKEKMAEEAKSIMDMGLKIIKVKLGKNGKEDVKRIHAIRNVIGDTIKLRLDANQGWKIDEAIQTLKSLEKYKIEYLYYEKVSFEELNELYNCLDLYIVSSRIEGGPQSIFECGLSKTPILSLIHISEPTRL